MQLHQKLDHLPLLLMAAEMNRTTQKMAQTMPEPEVRVKRQPIAPYLVGVDLGGTQTRAAVVRGAEVIAKVSHPTPAEDGPPAVVATIVAAINEALALAETGVAEIGGIGISSPGPLDPHKGIVFEQPNMRGWKDVPLRDAVSNWFPGIPVFLGHDATLAGLGEFMFGAGRGASTMIYMTVSTGIGGGIIIEDRIVDGAGGTAGEIGHMYIDIRPDALVCGAGHRGCLEALGSGTAIARAANALIESGKGQGIAAVHRELAQNAPEARQTAPEIAQLQPQPHMVSARDVVEAAERGDAEALEIITAAAQAVGIGCVNLLHILNPEMIVIGGGVTKAGPLLFDPIHAVIAERAFTRPAQTVQIAPAELGDDVGLIGAAAYVGYRQKHG